LEASLGKIKNKTIKKITSFETLGYLEASLGKIKNKKIKKITSFETLGYLEESLGKKSSPPPSGDFYLEGKNENKK
jgi:hypothetical protein